MKTITFYSYKGGVGRSLALSNMATRLSEFNKKVCVIDFDLEAPGMHFKFKKYTHQNTIKNGIVDYINEFSAKNIIPNNIKDYSVTYTPSNKLFGPITLIPAGNIDDVLYWEKLSKINWGKMFYSEGGNGVAFFLDLKAKIEKEFNPDVLLIDSRTGITDISGITLKILADEVIILCANNEENLDGSKRILRSLLNKENNVNENLKFHFVLTRLPFTDSALDRTKENRIIEKLKLDFKTDFGLENLDINIIHSDRRLEESEQLLIGDEYEEKAVSIANDYLNLFDKISEDILHSTEIQKFKAIKLAAKEFLKSKNPKIDFKTRIEHINKAIAIDSTNSDYLKYKGFIYYNSKEYEIALENYKKASEIDSDDFETISYIGSIYYQKRDNKKAIEFFDKIISKNPSLIEAYVFKALALGNLSLKDEKLLILNKALSIEPFNPKALNSRADLYRERGNYSKAYQDIFLAIEQDPDEPIYFATLAEIYAQEGNINEFYHNLNIAFSKNLKLEDLKQTMDVYGKFQAEERFIKLLEKYGFDSDELFTKP
ncbi:MAG: KGGVGR-motif variant AAA ATPase [Candidatus Methylacidiphilales bacterium]